MRINNASPQIRDVKSPGFTRLRRYLNRAKTGRMKNDAGFLIHSPRWTLPRDEDSPCIICANIHQSGPNNSSDAVSQPRKRIPYTCLNIIVSPQFSLHYRFLVTLFPPSSEKNQTETTTQCNIKLLQRNIKVVSPCGTKPDLALIRSERADIFEHARAAASWNRFGAARNHVITRIKRSPIVGTNLISEFPAANYLATAAMRPNQKGKRETSGRRRNSGPLAKLLSMGRVCTKPGLAWATFSFVDRPKNTAKHRDCYARPHSRHDPVRMYVLHFVPKYTA